jgi:ferredoxin
MRLVGEEFVDESDLDFSKFRCCGDEDLYPFRCTSCGTCMVFCYECDTLYPNLKTLIPGAEVNSLDPNRPIFHCPQCAFAFEYYFMGNPAYHARKEDWRKAGFAPLLMSHNDP